MAAQSNNLDEFLNRVQHFIDRKRPSDFIRPFALYHSLEFSCVAAKSGSEWLLVAGRAALCAEPLTSDPLLSIAFSSDRIVALSGHVAAGDVEGLVNYLKDSAVPTGNTGYNIRLMPEGAGEWVWQGPGVRPVDKGLYPWSRWKSELWLHGGGTSVSSLLAPWWHQIDDQLLRAAPPFKGFNGLCRKLRIPAADGRIGHSFFNISAELPAQFASVRDDRRRHTVEVDFECIGTPSLMGQWLPEGDLARVEWQYDPNANSHHVSMEVPSGSAELDLTLLFEGLGQADSLRYRVPREGILTRVAEYFDPQQTRLQEYLSEKTSVDANPFELAVARLLSTGGFVVQWFGKASKEALPDIVAYWRSPLGQEQLILAECTTRDPTRKLTDLIHRRKLMSEGTGIAANRILPVLFLRISATAPDFKAAAERGVALCDAERLRELRDRIMSGESPLEILTIFRAWARTG
jgi:hypothetical protein